MADILTGADALGALNGEGGNENNSIDFTKFSSGTTILVKVIGQEINGTVIGDFAMYYNYGIFKKVNSFTAKNPSKKSAKGYPVENLTPWDKAWKYHADKSEEFNDEHSKEANKYRAKPKFMFGFIDLDSGKPIVVDLTKNQAQAVNNAIKKYGNKVDKLAFELSKEGASTNTTVSLTPYLDDLTADQQKHFDNAPEKFDGKLFENILYQADDDEMVGLLKQAGFDVSLIGLTTESTTQADDDEPTEIDDLELPF
ncbi:hypothetical protein [Virgibacillus pantothenticus]|uniref:hypothetical protein n=1 Tax=Virgibacillus pantothenticus TaxID=1473 RepID=UPI0009871003|nr:hypothetical protein [Virgibacillus pantothenticus]